MPMTVTPTPTREAVSLTRIEVTRPRGGGRVDVRISAMGAADRPVIRPMLVTSDEEGARVCLVPEGALLLAGDAIRIEIVVGPGAHLDLVEPGGTVAYAMAGASASWDVIIDVGANATLVWAGEPFVVAERANVRRHTEVRLGWDAVVALRETLVFGRSGEGPGILHQRFEATGPNDVPLVVESLDVGPDSSPLLLGGVRTMGTVTVLGRRLPAAAESNATRLDLDGEGTIVRGLADDAHRCLPADLWSSARRLGG